VARVDLNELFDIQAELNKKIGHLAPNTKVRDEEEQLIWMGGWLHNYIMAMQSEVEELRDCVYWKHWYKEAREGKRFYLKDINEAKKEVVDLLFFWMSMAQVLGMTAEDVATMYKEKAKVNHQRRDDDCSTEEAKGYVR